MAPRNVTEVITIILLLNATNGIHTYIAARSKGCVDVGTAGICTLEAKMVEDLTQVNSKPKHITWRRLRDEGGDVAATLAHVSVNGRTRKKIDYKSRHAGFVTIRKIEEEIFVTTMTVIVPKNTIGRFVCEGEPVGGKVEIVVNVTESIERHKENWHVGDKRWRRRVLARQTRTEEPNDEKWAVFPSEWTYIRQMAAERLLADNPSLKKIVIDSGVCLPEDNASCHRAVACPENGAL